MSSLSSPYHSHSPLFWDFPACRWIKLSIHKWNTILISILLLFLHLLLLVSSALSSCLVSRTHAYKYMPNTFVLLSTLQSSRRFSPRFRPVISKLIEPINHSFSSSPSVSPFLSSYQNYSFLSDCSVFRTYKSTQLLSSSLCWKRTNDEIQVILLQAHQRNKMIHVSILSSW